MPNAMEKKTLKELLEMTSGDYQVKIGTKSGSGFLWCGSITELKSNWSALENIVKDKYKERLKKAKSHLNGLFRECPTVGRYAQMQYKGTNEFGSVDGYLEALGDYFKELERAKSKITKAEQRLKDLVPMQEREVYKAYRSVVDPDCAIILVYGTEVGAAWDYAEFKQWESERANAKEEDGNEEQSEEAGDIGETEEEDK